LVYPLKKSLQLLKKNVMTKTILFLFLPLQLLAQTFTPQEIARWQKQAQQVTIIRDNWGIPHVYGKTDADAVFGLLYAQCEDDFKRVEINYIEKLGRTAELKGSPSIYDDLLMRMIIDTAAAEADYKKSPAWLKKLCNAFADGINYYLYKNPQVKPALLTRFQPYFPLLWTDGSIGAINTADLTSFDLTNLYGNNNGPLSGIPSLITNDIPEGKLTGSNGFAFAPKITESGNAILYINPHVTFYFRPEVHMVSEEGLNAYGAVTWGQFFVYQGFNEHCGWMHTSTAVDAADTYIEKISKQKNKWVYEYDHKQEPLIEKKISLRYKTNNGTSSITINALFTRHGPVMAKRNGQFLSLRADNRIYNGLVQCWQRTKATGFEDFKKTMALNGNISNNTVYADGDGNIAYWHGNRIPKRDPSFDWTKPVDGTNPATDWKGLHHVDETVHIYNPENGWIQNCNSTPFTAAGSYSPKRNNFPRYMAPDEENFRGLNAVKVLGAEKSYTIDKVIKAGYDTYLTAFEVLVPALVQSFEKNILPSDTLYAYLAGPVSVLKNWDYRSGENSIATTLAVEWGQRILPAIFRTRIIVDEESGQVDKAKYFAEHASPKEIIEPLLATIQNLEKRFGRWQLPWGTINRFQRISGDIDHKFDDQKESIPVGFVSSTWGMLPSYTSSTYAGTQKRYGVNGNSFICAVEFGKKIKAKSLLAGGESGDPQSKHFFDQGTMYSKGQFKEVLFYKEEVLKHAEKTYHPGE
jgi:acyl-homoserine lactone acylase PvdQ